MIIKASESQLDIVSTITQQTIGEIYPRYYASGAVDFFKSHHCEANIMEDIKKGIVYLLEDCGEYVGTVTIKKNEICRLFVLPQKQHKGYGQLLLDFSEKKICENYSKIILDASLPAKRIYIKRGYRDVEYNQILTDNGDILCYDVMEKMNFTRKSINSIAIIFPGIGYTAEKPLLYYGLDVACECGYEEYRRVSFQPLGKSNIRGNEEAMKVAFDKLYSVAEEQLKDIDWKQYDDIVFISKSIGTIIAGAYATKHGLVNVKHVLYTPLTYTYKYEFAKAIAFIGTNDAWSDYKEVVALSEKAGIPIKVYQNRNHSLEVEGDVQNNINCIWDVMKVTGDFLKQ